MMRPTDRWTIVERAVQLREDEIGVARELHSLNVEIEQLAAKSAGQLRQPLVVCAQGRNAAQSPKADSYHPCANPIMETAASLLGTHYVDLKKSYRLALQHWGVSLGVILVPTPGHTECHQLLDIRKSDSTVVAAGQSHDTATAYSADLLA